MERISLSGAWRSRTIRDLIVKREVFIDTDVMAAYLTHGGPTPSALRVIASAAQCFTSVLHGTELVACASNDTERYLAESVLWGMHVLGFHQRYTIPFGDLHRTHGAGRPLRDTLTAGMCILNRLPLVTMRPLRYRAFRDLTVFNGGEVRSLRDSFDTDIPAQSWQG